METRNDFGFAFGHIERCTVGFRHSSDEIYDE